jgi:hypothetical protein
VTVVSPMWACDISGEVHGCHTVGPSRTLIKGDRPAKVENKISQNVYSGAESDQLTTDVRTKEIHVRTFYRLAFHHR